MRIEKHKNKIIKFGLLALMLSLLSAFQSIDSDEPWVTIFNGKDFSGWSIVGSFGKATIEKGVIITNMVSNTPEHTFIRTNKKYKDFILESDCKVDGNIHSGFLLRCVKTTDTAKVSLYGYQVKLDPNVRKWSGGVFDDYGKSFKWWYTLADDARAREAFKMNEWNHFRMEVIGNSIKVWVNDIPTCNLINSKYSKGYIALKIHSLGNNPEREKATVCFKNIRIITKSPKKYARKINLLPKVID